MSAHPCPIERIIKRDGNVVAYDRDRIATAIFKAAVSVGDKDRARAETMAEAVEKRLVAAYAPPVLPSVEDIQDTVEEVLMTSGHTQTARAFIVYRHDRAKVRDGRRGQVEATDNIPYRTIYEVLRWNMAHGCETVEGLNEILAGGRYPDLVRACDARYDQEVRACARNLINRLPGVRLVIIAGPSSSGKTTTTIKLGETLKAAGLELVTLNLDRYYFDVELHPRDEFGDHDYETPQALDLSLINQHLFDLLAGRAIKTPHYDFKTGKRTLAVHDLALGPRQVLLIDSLHGLYEPMTASIPADQKFRIYIETLGQLRDVRGNFMRWADNRLLRRMIRDSWGRKMQPLETLAHWHYVRRSELQHIIPFIGTVDELVNSALPYEMPVLKAKLARFLPEAVQRYRNEPGRQDAYLRARRIADLLDDIQPVTDETVIPADSLLREFIGGSRYAY